MEETFRTVIVASSNKNDVFDRKILSHDDWQIVTDVSKECNAYIFRVKPSLTKGSARHNEEGPSTPHTLGKDSKIFIYTSISEWGCYNTV